MILKRSKKPVVATAMILLALMVPGATIVRSKIASKIKSPISKAITRTRALGSVESKVGNSAVVGNVRLLAEPEKQTFKVREQITLRLSLHNNTNKEIYIIQTNPIIDNELEIRDAKGKKVPMSEKGKRLLDSPVLSRIVSRIGPGQSMQYTITVNTLYDLSAVGSYTVTVKRKFLMRDKKTFGQVESSPAKFIVRL